MATTDVFETLKVRRMSAAQYLTIVVGLLLVILDGYDIAITSFASPYIAHGLNVNPAELGMVGSGALVGLMIGATVIAPWGDHVGRRTTAIAGAVLASAGMGLSTIADSLNELILGRIVSGAGIGTLIAAIAVIFSEYVSRRAYALVMALYAAGIPLGTLLGSHFAGPVIEEHGWRIGFEIGLYVTALCVPLTMLAIPESLAYLASGRARNSLKRFNKQLRRLGMDEVTELPHTSRTIAVKAPVSEVFTGAVLTRTALAMSAYFLFMIAFYFTTNWAPKYLADVTGDRSVAPDLMSVYSIGGLVGIAIFALVTARVTNLYLVTAAMVALAAVALVIYGYAAGADQGPFLAIALASFFLSAGTAGFYAIVPRLYPEKIRSTGYGLVIGFGRLGGILGPILGGALFHTTISRDLIFWIFAVPLVLSMMVLFAMRRIVSDEASPSTSVVAEPVALIR